MHACSRKIIVPNDVVGVLVYVSTFHYVDLNSPNNIFLTWNKCVLYS